MKTPYQFNLPYYLGKPPRYLWSRGWYGIVDECGDGTLSYRAQRTERRSRSLGNLIGKSGVIWLRIGSSPWHKKRPSDIITFADQVAGRLGGKTILVTTDGDMTMPTDLPSDTVNKILDDPNIVAWYTQNYAGTPRCEKLKPIPIGLDLHTGPNSLPINPRKKASWFTSAMENVLPVTQKTRRVWSDVHFKNNPGRHGDPRSALQEALLSKKLGKLVDIPKHRLSHKQIWEIYGRYLFVVSLPGAGLDVHRTWEALALGAIVITVHTSLDELLAPYKVVFVNADEPEWWRVLDDQEWLKQAAELGLKGRQLDLSWRFWGQLVRESINRQVVGSN